MDGLSLHFSIFELAGLIGGKIDKVQQPEKDALLLTVRAAGNNFRLYISIHAENGRIQLTENEYSNPVEPPSFCMLLRKKLTGGRITAIDQRGLDRYFVITVQAKNEMDDTESLYLHIEIMGKYSNITLVHEGIILDSIKHVSPYMSSVRMLLPGISFTPPPLQDKISPFELTVDLAQNFYDCSCPEKQMQTVCAGLSREISAQIVEKCPSHAELLSLFRELKENRYFPCLLQDTFGAPISVLPFIPASKESHVVYPSLWQALDAFYLKRDRFVSMHRSAQGLKHSIEIILKSRQTKLDKYRMSIASSEEADTWRKYGNLITANIYRIKKGQSAVLLEDYESFSQKQIPVPLDPLKSPVENAQNYYKRYKKMRSAANYATEQIALVQEESSWLEGQLDNIEKCENSAELDEIRDELTALGYLKKETRKSKPGKAPTSSPLCFEAENGIAIYVGKNNKQNEYLTFKQAGAENLWLHVKDIPGSHVIVSAPGMPDEQTLYTAAMLAAYFSKARESVSVPVDYTFRKNIKKPSGARPGTVIFSTNKTVFVTPTEQYIRSLKEKRSRI